jgi:ubiquinone/menaquinone biosynthesis C-methylase UbiE
VLRRIHDRLFRAGGHDLPRWIGLALDNAIRRRLQDPRRLLAPWVRSGDRVLDLGTGTGYFLPALAGLVGPGATVVATDRRQAMLDAAAARAVRHGLRNVRFVLAGPDGLPETGPLDFVLMFYVLHEVRGRQDLLRDVAGRLSDRGRVLLAEPWGHVSATLFAREMEAATAAGFEVVSRPGIALSRAALLRLARRQER